MSNDRSNGNKQSRGGNTGGGRDDDAVHSFDFGSLLNEGVESLGDNLSDDASQGFMRRIAARLWRSGIRSSGAMTGAVVAIKAAIKTRNWSPNAKAFLEGVAEGLEDSLRYQMRRFREIEQDQGPDALKKELDKALGSSHGAREAHAEHGNDHGAHGTTTHAGPSTGAAKDAKTLIGYITRLPPNKRQLGVEFYLAFEELPKVLALIEQCQAREGFLDRLFERVAAFSDNRNFLMLSVKKLLGDELAAIKHEQDHKPMARLKHAAHEVFGALEAGMDTVGVPKIGHGHGHDHNDHDSHPVPASPGFGDDWGTLMNKIHNH